MFWLYAGMRVVCRLCLWVVRAQSQRDAARQRTTQCVCGMRVVCVGMRLV